MPAKILSGREAGSELLKKIAGGVKKLTDANERPPSLVVVQVGDHAASGPYIRQKEKAARECGFVFTHARLAATDDFTTLKSNILRYVDDPRVDGIILQLPLDSERVKDHAQIEALLQLIPPTKDADGLHPLNQGFLFTGESSPTAERSAHPIPATALGTVRLLQHFQIPIMGRDAVVVGRSRLVGAPVALLLTHMGATVTICHSRTRDLIAHTRRAEIVIACAGRKHLIGPEHIAPGAVIVDVGIHVTEDGKLTGDVDPACREIASAYSPVPGGVGPMTVAGLIENAFNLRVNRS